MPKPGICVPAAALKPHTESIRPVQQEHQLRQAGTIYITQGALTRLIPLGWDEFLPKCLCRKRVIQVDTLISAFQDNVQSRTVDSQFGASEYK